MPLVRVTANVPKITFFVLVINCGDNKTDRIKFSCSTIACAKTKAIS